MTSQKRVAVEPADTRQVFGKKTDISLDVVVKNGLTSAIKSVALRENGADPAYQPNLMEASQKFAANEEVHVLWEPGDKKDANFDLGVVLEDDRIVEFLNVPLAKLSSLTLQEADGVAFVDYEQTDGTKGSTKDAALAAKAEAEAAEAERKAQEEAAAAAAAAAAQEAAQQQAAPVAEPTYTQEPTYVAEPTYTEPTYVAEPTYTEPVAPAEPTYSEPAPAEPAPVEAPSQSDESCLGDDIVLRVQD